MEGDRAKRRLAAIVAADIAGYSRLVGADEEGTLARLKALRREVVDPRLAEHAGRIVKTTGDGLLMEFASAVDAVRCVVEIQRAMAAREEGLPENRRLRFRIGVNVGDIVVDGDDILGDGVNVAARLEQLAEPGGICVSARAHEDVRGRLDLDVQDIGEQTLKNIERPIRVFRIAVQAPGATPLQPVLSLPDKPSIAVLPFQNMSGDPEQEYFADGMVEEIITALSRFHWLFVIARNSSFTYKGKAVDVKRVSRELGVRYVLEGSVRKSGRKVRITGQLIDGTSGAHIWADRFDGALDDIFDLQDQVTMSVVGAIEPKLRQAEIDRAARKPTESLDAYDHLLRAYAHFHRITREGNAQALAHLGRALEIDPTFSAAAGLAAWCYHWRRPQGWSVSVEKERIEGCRLARIVADGDKDDPAALAYAAHAMASLCRDHRAAVSLIERALRLNPNSFIILNIDGWIRLLVHEYDRAQSSFEAAQRLSPLDPLVGTMMCGLSHAYWFRGQTQEALHWAELAIQANPNFTSSYVALIVAQVVIGQLENARITARKLLDLDPSHSIGRQRASSYKDMSLLEPRVAALRAAGIPE